MSETQRLRIDRTIVGSLTVGELELLEEKTGRPLSKLFDEDSPRGSLLHTLAFIQLTREDPDATWDEAGKVVVELADDEPEVGTTAPDPSPAGRRRRPA